MQYLDLPIAVFYLQNNPKSNTARFPTRIYNYLNMHSLKPYLIYLLWLRPMCKIRTQLVAVKRVIIMCQRTFETI